MSINIDREYSRIMNGGHPYVYCHRLASTGEVFYVGSGQYGRALDHNRNSIWCPIANEEGPFEVEILSVCDTRKEAEKIEIALIKKLQPRANIVHTELGRSRAKEARAKAAPTVIQIQQRMNHRAKLTEERERQLDELRRSNEEKSARKSARLEAQRAKKKKKRTMSFEQRIKRSVASKAAWERRRHLKEVA